MKHQSTILFLVLSLVLTACNGIATEPTIMPANPATDVDPSIPTETAASPDLVAPAVTETSTVPPLPPTPAGTGLNSIAFYDGKTLYAEDCSYGGYFEAIEATAPMVVTFTLCKPDPAFLYKIALNSFSIYPREWIEATSGDQFRKLEGLEKPVGTGPYMIIEWKRGESITFVKNPAYWGYSVLAADTLVFRWSTDSAQRLDALQAGAIDGYDGVSSAELAAMIADPNLQLAIRSGLNISYLGMNNIFAPFDNFRVRQGIAKGIDRQRILDMFYPPGSELAKYFTPCSVPNGCFGEEWYGFDPVDGRLMLSDGGYPNGFKTKLYYREVEREYLPQVDKIALEIQRQLKENLNVEVDLVPMDPNSFTTELYAGRLRGLYLFGLEADYPHITDFLDFRFGRNSQQFGRAYPDIYNSMEVSFQSITPVDIEKKYAETNNTIRKLVPMVPIAHAGSVVAYRSDVENPQASPLAFDYFSNSKPASRTVFTWVQNAEPDSLFCADESDTDTLRACAQVMEGLYVYEANSTAIKPALATECSPGAEPTVWVCTLRPGVKFHDGSELDSADVVATFNMALNPGSPYHKGSKNLWEYYDALWGLMWE